MGNRELSKEEKFLYAIGVSKRTKENFLSDILWAKCLYNKEFLNDFFHFASLVRNRSKCIQLNGKYLLQMKRTGEMISGFTPIIVFTLLKAKYWTKIFLTIKYT